MSGKYDDIIGLPHHRSERHPQMSMHDRAAQFSPFAALTGHDAAIRETARLTEEEPELTEEIREDNGRVLSELERLLEKRNAERTETGKESAGPAAAVTWFVPDTKKTGGAVRTAEGSVKKLRRENRSLLMEDGTEIPAEHILSIRILKQ